MGFTSSAYYYIDDIPCFAANGVFSFKIVVCTFGGALNVWFGIKGFRCQAVTVTFLISGGALGTCSQRRLMSRSILYMIFSGRSTNLEREVQSLARKVRRKFLGCHAHFQ